MPMERPNSQQISEQSTSYRRGLVMGLTMAEVGILIIFVLLMLIGLNLWRSQKQDKEKQDHTSVKNERLQSLESTESLMTQLQSVMQWPQNPTAKEIQTLIRGIQETAASPEGQSTLKKVRQAIEEMRSIKDAVIKGGGAKELAEQAMLQSYRIADQERNLQRYESQLREAGLGTGERACWLLPDGNIDFLYDIVLENGGIRMRERPHPEREAERALLPMPAVNPKEVLSQLEFRQRTYLLYERSLQMNCRFFVVIYDGTGPTEKELYKALLKTVEGYFYKTLADGTPPF
jgi:hypothetical protein